MQEIRIPERTTERVTKELIKAAQHFESLTGTSANWKAFFVDARDTSKPGNMTPYWQLRALRLSRFAIESYDDPVSALDMPPIAPWLTEALRVTYAYSLSLAVLGVMERSRYNCNPTALYTARSNSVYSKLVPAIAAFYPNEVEPVTQFSVDSGVVIKSDDRDFVVSATASTVSKSVFHCTIQLFAAAILSEGIIEGLKMPMGDALKELTHADEELQPLIRNVVRPSERPKYKRLLLEYATHGFDYAHFPPIVQDVIEPVDAQLRSAFRQLKRETRNRLEPIQNPTGTLVDMRSSAGNALKAQHIIDQAVDLDDVTWSAVGALFAQSIFLSGRAIPELLRDPTIMVPTITPTS